METIWLLDFDGVINANKPGWSAAPRQANAYADGKHYRIRWEPKLISRIRQVQQAGVLIFWASTWCGHTDQLERILLLPTLFSAAPTAMSYRTKCEAAEAVIASGNRLIWTDDEVVPDWGALYTKLTRKDRALLIRPKSNRGLRPEHMDAIDEFVRKS